jgi:adenylate cyclase
MQGAYATHRLSSGRLPRPQRLAVMVGLGLLFAYLLSWSGIVQTLELATYDLRLWLRGPRSPPPSIVIVAINDESFTVLNQNIRTWQRSNYARLIDAIAAGQPAVIGMDVAWVHASTEPKDDEALARSLRQAGNVVLASLIEHQAGAGYEYNRYAAPIAPLAHAASGVGLVNLPRDNDGVVRRATLWRFHNDAWYPAFGYEVVRVYLGQPVVPFDSATGVVTLGEHLFQLNGRQDLLINFCGGQATFPAVSMYQVLQGEVPAETFADKIVLIGFTTSLEQDLHATAFNPPWGSPDLIPGAEVHANVIASLLSGDPIRRAPAWLSTGLSLTAVALSVLAFWRLRPAQAVIIVGGSALLYLAAAFLLFARADLWLPTVSPVGLVAMTVTGGLVERVLIEEREKRRIRARFQSFMAPERLAAVLGRWEELAAEDRSEITATVLFADIRGFTSATEALTRQGRSGEVIRFLNRYSDAMIEAIFAEHGVLDKMLGDGLLVLFGAPEPTPDHALLAVRAALRMAALLPELNAVWPLRDQRPLRVGIGIHSGSLMDGIVGRGRRVEYTVIGDVVNTASRVQDYTKEVLARRIEREGDDGQPGVTILITQATYAQVRDRVTVDPDVPPCQAKGKAEPIPVYRVLGLSALEGGNGGAA